jgi:hypothetical protein
VGADAAPLPPGTVPLAGPWPGPGVARIREPAGRLNVRQASSQLDPKPLALASLGMPAVRTARLCVFLVLRCRPLPVAASGRHGDPLDRKVIAQLLCADAHLPSCDCVMIMWGHIIRYVFASGVSHVTRLRQNHQGRNPPECRLDPSHRLRLDPSQRWIVDCPPSRSHSLSVQSPRAGRTVRRDGPTMCAATPVHIPKLERLDLVRPHTISAFLMQGSCPKRGEQDDGARVSGLLSTNEDTLPRAAPQELLSRHQSPPPPPLHEPRSHPCHGKGSSGPVATSLPSDYPPSRAPSSPR